MEEALKKLVLDAASLPEDAMRLDLLRRRFAGFGPEEIASFLSSVYRDKRRSKGIEHIKSLLVDPASLASLMDRDKLRATYAAALEMGHMRVSRLFTDLSPRMAGLAGYDKEEEARMEHISLGERRSLGKVLSRETLSRLLSDPDPIVMTNILNNPRVVEKDVVKVASKRPNSPLILGVIARHGKWSRNYNVRKALVMNPYTKPRLAVGLIGSLLFQDVVKIADDMTLHAQVRAAARDIIEEKSA
jgi:hypothetical protein